MLGGHNYYSRFASMLVGMCCIVAAPSLAQDSSSEAVRQEIAEFYAARADALNSLRLEWAGGRYAVEEEGSFAGSLEEVIEAASLLEASGTVVIADGGVRFDRTADTLNVSTGQVYPARDYLHAYNSDSNESRALTPERQTGVIQPGDDVSRWLEVQYLTMSLVDTPGFLLDENIEYLGIEERPEGVRAVFGTPPESPNAAEFLLDPDRDFVVTAHRRWRPDGTLDTEAILEYAFEPGAGYIPSEFQFIEYGFDGESIEYLVQHSVTAVDFDFPVDDSIFELKFPDGTEVYDAVRDIQYTAGGPDDPAVKLARAAEAAVQARDAENADSPNAEQETDTAPKTESVEAEVRAEAIPPKTSQAATGAPSVAQSAGASPASHAWIWIAVILVAAGGAGLVLWMRRART